LGVETLNGSGWTSIQQQELQETFNGPSKWLLFKKTIFMPLSQLLKVSIMPYSWKGNLSFLLRDYVIGMATSSTLLQIMTSILKETWPYRLVLKTMVTRGHFLWMFNTYGISWQYPLMKGLIEDWLKVLFLHNIP
jgi:hypothetical protein